MRPGLFPFQNMVHTAGKELEATVTTWLYAVLIRYSDFEYLQCLSDAGYRSRLLLAIHKPCAHLAWSPMRAFFEGSLIPGIPALALSPMS